MNPKGRYEIRAVLPDGEGGMGIVYRAFDPVLKREVTLKTIRDSQDQAVLELFRRECGVLASMTHPNIVEIFDIGEVEEAGGRKPYFVMPLLQGETLKQLIDSSSPRLTVERSVHMIVQACRGLQAAHDQGLIHRDIKPSNLFILADDSVKIIDFGVAHLTSQLSSTGVKGTVPYMAPEQLRMKQPTPLSDQFSIAVVCYEMLARRHPFRGTGEADVPQAILKHSPASVSEMNPSVSAALSQVVHKALAKEPFYRFSTVREFSECLQKALRGEVIDKFDPARIVPRIDRARKALVSGDLEDASEIISELESANYLAPEIRELRQEIDQKQKAKTTSQLLETARRRFDEGEYLRALQKVQEILNLDPDNSDAFALKGTIESRHSASQIDDWFKLAHQHMENYAFSLAREALEKVLERKSSETRAKMLLREVERREQEYFRLRNEKQDIYKSAISAFNRGDLNSAINKLDQVLDLDRKAPNSTSPEHGAEFQQFYEQVRSKRDQVASHETEARRYLETGQYPAALALCDEILATYPNNVVFRVLRDDIELAQRQEVSAYVARIENDLAAEPDLDRKVSILEQAKQKYQFESRFDQLLQQILFRRDSANAIAGRARSMEEAKQFSDALSQWETLRNIYPKYPGLDIEIDRIKKRREQQQRENTKTHWVDQIDHALSLHNYDGAHALVIEALAEFAGDSELAALEGQVLQAQTQAIESEAKIGAGKKLYAEGQIESALSLLRDAARLNPHNALAQSSLLETLLQEAGFKMERDWRAAEPFVLEALELDSASREARSLATVIQDKRRSEEVSQAMSRARRAQSDGRAKEAIKIIDDALALYPGEKRLIQFRDSVLLTLPTNEQQALRQHDLQELNKLNQESQQTQSPSEMESIFEKSKPFLKYSDDPDFGASLSQIDNGFQQIQRENQVSDSRSRVADDQQKEIVYERLAPNKPPTRNESQPAQTLRGLPPILKSVTLALVGFVVMVGLIWFVLHRSKPHPASFATAIARIDVRGALVGEYKIYSADGADVTSRSFNGLSAGAYKIAATRSGFQTFEQAFAVNPMKDSLKVIQINWQPLTADLLIALTPRMGGLLSIDGQEQHPEDSGEIRAPLSRGPHSVLWQMAGVGSLELPFEIQDKVVLKAPIDRSTVFGIAAVLNGSEMTYQQINLAAKGLSKVINGKSEPLDSTGTFSIPNTDAVGFSFYATSLGSFKLKGNRQAIYLHLDRVPYTGGGIPVKSKVEPPTGQSDVAIDPKAEEEKRHQEEERQREEIRKKYRQDSGIDK